MNTAGRIGLHSAHLAVVLGAAVAAGALVPTNSVAGAYVVERQEGSRS